MARISTKLILALLGLNLAISSMAIFFGWQSIEEIKNEIPYEIEYAVKNAVEDAAIDTRTASSVSPEKPFFPPGSTRKQEASVNPPIIDPVIRAKESAAEKRANRDIVAQMEKDRLSAEEAANRQELSMIELQKTIEESGQKSIAEKVAEMGEDTAH